MAVFDIIVLVCIGIAVFFGIFKGFIRQAVSFAGLFIAVWLGTKATLPISTWLHQWIDLDIVVLKVIAFIAIFFTTLLAMALMGKLLDKVIRVAMLGWLNRLLGAVLSVCECLFFLGMGLMLFDALNSAFNLTAQEKLDESMCYAPLKTLAYAVFPYLKQLFFWN
ncbi:MAG: CvpA family protein [Candidatus Cryptobacteroides sp.]